MDLPSRNQSLCRQADLEHGAHTVLFDVIRHVR
jgi:hypothetical protein